ncbi:hypothetical protein D8674_032743 [Pyrus ussuriensis x Pyrus communis]|uniref:Myb/SANT-like domain-containing protein n=1 Tax=Pyrus ussuriensis x Pyrus communis TaxID=2448454 RepID=A0A5N5HJX8_9ROSA|nr:hypothetical protein D8674_032743 [Pyrus ussuriensis x Pyrus communis]
MGCQTAARDNDRSRTYWTATMESYFIDLMLEQMHRGARVGHASNNQVWTEMLSVFNAQVGSRCDKDVLKSRYTTLWKLFDDVKSLLGQDGFSWDESRQMVVADEYVWDAYNEVQFFPYSRYSRPSHDVDFDDEVQGVTTGLYRFLIMNLRPRQGVGMEAGPIVFELEMNGASGDLQLLAEDIEISDQQSKRPTVASPNTGHSKKAQKMGQDTQKAPTEMVGRVAKLVDNEEKNNYTSMEKAINALPALADMDDDATENSSPQAENKSESESGMTISTEK